LIPATLVGKFLQGHESLRASSSRQCACLLALSFLTEKKDYRSVFSVQAESFEARVGVPFQVEVQMVFVTMDFEFTIRALVGKTERTDAEGKVHRTSVTIARLD